MGGGFCELSESVNGFECNLYVCVFEQVGTTPCTFIICLFINVTCLQDTICCICKENYNYIAPEDGRVSPKHFELK